MFYQHVIAFCVIVIKLLSQAGARARLEQDGFFAGWSRLTLACSLGMWLYFWAATAVTARLGATAGAMGLAVAIPLTGVGEALILGRTFTWTQQLLMVAICANAVLFATLKAKARKA